jgi:hypothetical protein
MEVAGISAGLGAMSLAKQLRRLNEMSLANRMKAFPSIGSIDPRVGIKSKRAGNVMAAKLMKSRGVM